MNQSVDENPLGAPVQQMQPPAAQPKFGRIDAGLDQVDEAVEASKQHIFDMQNEDGHWVGELEADGMLEADYIFLHVLLETADPTIRGRMQRALSMFIVEGIHTSIPMQQKIMADPDFQAGHFDTNFIKRFMK